ncbi:hypothetical protein PVAND_010829 [Polypedilum vanderplanki]|uniref:tRNA-uridine aminocarboxypropyltransferase 1 n=1 Tax=Polypedilum vanderplanki TaxID=319348 RepID=A0A9J6CI17_POLVA|nr:hypothetical protein PVAND_010829 [Polypedilum vanderplanki]
MGKFKNPYPNLNIDDYSHLYEIDSRFKCSKCERSRKFFCYTCSKFPDTDNKPPPKVKIPFEINIIKHKQEVDGKSTSSHAKILTEDQVEIFIYPNIPDYRKEIDDVVLIFVSPHAVDIKSLLEGQKKFKLKNNYGLARGELMGTLLMKDLNEIKDEENDVKMLENGHEKKSLFLDKLPFKKAIFIDSTWKQCRSIFHDERLNSLTAVIIQHRKTIFWRKQKDVPDWFLSTIEAIHQFLIEVHIQAWGIEKHYFDNCLQDFRYHNTDWIPKEKIIDSEMDISEKRDKEKVPYNGQYDNILYFYSFFYSFIHSLDNPNAEFKSIKLVD